MKSDQTNDLLNPIRQAFMEDRMLTDELAILLIGRLRLVSKRYLVSLKKEIDSFDEETWK